MGHFSVSRSDHPIIAYDAGAGRVLQTHPIHVAADFDITFGWRI